MRKLRTTCPECGASIYDSYKCYHCGWKLEFFRDEGGKKKMSYAYEICPDCGGIKWVKLPDPPWYADDMGTGSASLKGCDCPPKPKPETELGITVLCPHCKGCVTVNIKGLPAESIYSTFFDEGEKG